jgi:hypothetical protein
VDGSRERDRSIERLLRQSLPTRQDGRVKEPCLDAETLAAWLDGGLSGAPLETAQAHVADCGRCQALVGTLARINSVVPPVDLGRAERRWLPWLVPLTAAAAAVALWIAVPHNKDAGLPPQTEVQGPAAESKARAPATLDDRPLAPASGKKEDQTAQASQTSKDDGRRPARIASGDASTSEGAGKSPVRPPAPEVRKDARGSEVDNLRRQPAPSSEITPSVSAGAAPAGPAAAAAPPPLAAPAARARSAERGSDTGAIEIVSPDAAIRWRIAGSTVQRSTSGGASWEAVPTGFAAEISAGAAPSASVCWLVGRGGIVLLSTDGRGWRRVAFPETTDLSAVRATDARTASVSTADGRTFSTIDGGVTWVRRPLQEF